MPRARLVAVGRIGRPHGLNGEVRLDPGSGLPRGLSGYTRFYLGPPEDRGTLDREPEPVTLDAARANGRFLLLKFPGIDDPESASRLARSRLYVERAEMPPLEPGEYYHADLLGCRIVDSAGGELGRVDDVVPSGPYDLLVIRSGSREWMLPIVDEYVIDMDLEAGEILVSLPEGGI
jgi:16S rRNA processing protein RimM